MNGTKLKQRLVQELPPVPESFHLAVTGTLNRLVAEEQTQPKETKRNPIPLRRVLLLAALIALAIATVAAAAIHWQFFDDLWPFAGAPNAADQVMRSHLAQVTVNNVEITVEEAGYDGRSLLLVYSYRMLDVDSPLGMYRVGQTGPGVTQEDLQLLSDHNVGWWIDHIWVDGKAMDMPANSYGDTYGSSTPGKLTEKWVYRLDNEAFSLNGPVEISLPIGQRQPLTDYSRWDHPEKYANDGTLMLPDVGMVTFTLDTAHHSPVVVTEPNEPTRMKDFTAAVSEAAFSPLMSYITLTMDVSPDALAAYKATFGEGYCDSDGHLIYSYDGSEIIAPWLFALQLVDGAGNTVTTEGGNNGYSATWAEFIYPAVDNLPAELWLAPVENGQADMSRAVRVR